MACNFGLAFRVRLLKILSGAYYHLLIVYLPLERSMLQYTMQDALLQDVPQLKLDKNWNSTGLSHLKKFSLHILYSIDKFLDNAGKRRSRGYSTPICLLACTCGGIHPGRVEPASPRHGNVSWVGSMPRPSVLASLHLLALQLKPSLSGLRAPSMHSSHPPFWF